MTLLHASSQTTASQSSPFLPLKRKAGHEVDELSAPPKKRIASAARVSTYHPVLRHELTEGSSHFVDTN
jgi:hypothetical protein